jgi:hypothetical protein
MTHRESAKNTAAYDYLEGILREVLQNTPEEKALEMMETYRDGGAVGLLLTGNERDVHFVWNVGAKPQIPESKGSA